jgi:hypothetical protein
MSAASEASINLSRDDRQASHDQTQLSGLLSAISNFLNSSFGLWFLSSVLLSAAVFVYQTWQDNKHQQEITTERVERLNLEIAGRLSQFGTWARVNLLQVDDKGHSQFSAGVNNTAIERASLEFLFLCLTSRNQSSQHRSPKPA